MTSDLVQRHPLKEKRRANKPLLERKRRARINDSLSDLKHLVLLSLNKDVSKFAKMEKVDILDMTVQFLKGRCFENRQEDYHRGYLDGGNEMLNALNIDEITKDKHTKLKVSPSKPPSFFTPPTSSPQYFNRPPRYQNILFSPSTCLLEEKKTKEAKPVWRPW